MLTESDIKRILLADGVAVGHAGDSFVDFYYLRPTLRWIIGPFAYALSEFQKVLETAKYHPESNDCDNYARLAAAFAQTLHNRTERYGQMDSALAFGEFFYTHRDGGRHVCNVAIVDDDKPIYFEPNGCRVVELTADEKRSCTSVRF